MNQRWKQVAALAAVVALVAASGCSALGLGGSSGTTILLVNDDNEAHDSVTVEVVDGEDGEELFSAEASPDAETDVELGTVSETGEYTLLVTVDGRTARMSYEFTEGDDTVSIGIDNDGNVFVGA